jgi:hypothetical protein
MEEESNGISLYSSGKRNTVDDNGLCFELHRQFNFTQQNRNFLVFCALVLCCSSLSLAHFITVHIVAVMIVIMRVCLGRRHLFFLFIFRWEEISRDAPSSVIRCKSS